VRDHDTSCKGTDAEEKGKKEGMREGRGALVRERHTKGTKEVG